MWVMHGGYPLCVLCVGRPGDAGQACGSIVSAILNTVYCIQIDSFVKAGFGIYLPPRPVRYGWPWRLRLQARGDGGRRLKPHRSVAWAEGVERPQPKRRNGKSCASRLKGDIPELGRKRTFLLCVYRASGDLFRGCLVCCSASKCDYSWPFWPPAALLLLVRGLPQGVVAPCREPKWPREPLNKSRSPSAPAVCERRWRCGHGKASRRAGAFHSPCAAGRPSGGPKGRAGCVAAHCVGASHTASPRLAVTPFRFLWASGTCLEVP